jgi:PAS domain S-box-containing protein
MRARDVLHDSPMLPSGPLNWLSTLGIRGQLLAGFIVVALFTGGLGVYALDSMRAVNHNQTLMYSDEFTGMDLFAEYANLADQTRLRVLSYLLTSNPTQREALHQRILDGDARISALAAQIDAVDMDRSDAANLASMTAAWAAYTRWRDTELFGPDAGDPARTMASYSADGVKFTTAFAEASDIFRANKRASAAELAASGAAVYEQTRHLVIALSVGAVLVALSIGFFVSRSIVRAVREVGSAAGKLAVGELDQQPDVRSHDELGQMADAFRSMVAYQKEMATVATAIAEGNLAMDIEPKSPSDVLGVAFQRMSRNLRAMVGELENQTATLGAQAQLLDLANDAVIVRDPEDGTIRFWNRGAEELYGWTRAEAIGKASHILLKTRFPESLEVANSELARSGRWNGELIHTRKDGTRITVACRQAVQYDETGQHVAVLTINTDVTQRIEAEAELARARDAAEAASAAKTVFLANTSHEIRTPMNAILGMAELLAETPLNDEQREYVRTFQRAGDTLLALINDVLDLSKVESGQLELERIPFDLSELVEHMAEVLAVRAHGKGLELNVHVLPDVPTRVMGDPTRLRQVLVNLMGNAIKFTDVGEVGLRVELNPSADGPSPVLFSVSDSGIGIPADKQGEIFASFVQADTSTTRRHGGTGLGLAISSRIVELMGGRIDVRSQPGHGSTFSFSIPLEVAPPAAQRLTHPTVDIDGWHVLVADDNATNRLILREFLTTLGANIVEAQDGLEALSAMHTAREKGQAFRLILLDGRMPELDGFEVATRLREEVGMLGETVVMLTSDTRAGDVARARELGLAAYLVKPIKRADLIASIASLANATPSEKAAADATPFAGPAEIAAAERPLRVLLVDDSADNRMLIQAYLKKLPYQIDTAEDGLAGFTRVREHDYDLVLMDMLMPVMDGLEATQAIRSWERAEGRQHTPVVALTANAMEEDVRRCLAAGCDAHVAKPVKKAALLASIARHARSA